MSMSGESLLLDGRPLLRRYHPFLAPGEARQLFERLLEDLPWEQPRVRVFGREHPAPRLQSWHGDPDAVYRYSGLTLRPLPWTRELGRIAERIEAVTGHRFNSVLANLYRDGRDSMGWHADDERELGPSPRVASVSLGAERDFALRRRGARRQALTLALRDNELLLMEPGLQEGWQHSLPRRLRIKAPRVNLTFRQVLPCP